jgi:hypothetical protein
MPLSGGVKPVTSPDEDFSNLAAVVQDLLKTGLDAQPVALPAAQLLRVIAGPARGCLFHFARRIGDLELSNDDGLHVSLLLCWIFLPPPSDPKAPVVGANTTSQRRGMPAITLKVTSECGGLPHAASAVRRGAPRQAGRPQVIPF